MDLLGAKAINGFVGRSLWSCLCEHLIGVEPSEVDGRPMWFHKPCAGGCTCRYVPGCGGGLPNPNPPAEPTAPS